MARQLYISYSTGVDSDRNKIWSDFTAISGLFPNIIFLDSDNLSGGNTKSVGVDIPNMHGIYPIQHPIKNTNKEFNFLARSTESREEAEGFMYRFLTYIYSYGEIRLSYFESVVGDYRRYKYYGSSDYGYLNGISGHDVTFTVTLTAIDTIKYSKQSTIIQTEGTATGNSYSTELTVGGEVQTLENTPVYIKMTLDSPNGGQFFNLYITVTNSFGEQRVFQSIGMQALTGNNGAILEIDSGVHTDSYKITQANREGDTVLNMLQYANGVFPAIDYGENTIVITVTPYTENWNSGTTITTELEYYQELL